MKLRATLVRLPGVAAPSALAALAALAVLCGFAAAGWWVHRHNLDLFFVVDDVPWLSGVGQVHRGRQPLWVFLMVPSREQLMPLWRLQYYLQWRAFGLDPWPWHLINLAAHVLSGGCLAYLVWRYGAGLVGAIVAGLVWSSASLAGGLNPLTQVACGVYSNWVLLLLVTMVAVTKASGPRGRRWALGLIVAASAMIATFGPSLVCLPAVGLQYYWLERRDVANPATDRVWRLALWGTFLFWSVVEGSMFLLVGFHEPAQRIQALGPELIVRLWNHYAVVFGQLFWQTTDQLPKPQLAASLGLVALAMGALWRAPRAAVQFGFVLWLATVCYLAPIVVTRGTADDFSGRYLYLLLAPTAVLVALVATAMTSWKPLIVRGVALASLVVGAGFFLVHQRDNVLANRAGVLRMYASVPVIYGEYHALFEELSNRASGSTWRVPDVPIHVPLYPNAPPSSFCHPLSSMYVLCFPHPLEGVAIVPPETVSDGELEALRAQLAAMDSPAARRLTQIFDQVLPDLRALAALGNVAKDQAEPFPLPDFALVYPSLGLHVRASEVGRLLLAEGGGEFKWIGPESDATAALALAKSCVENSGSGDTAAALALLREFAEPTDAVARFRAGVAAAARGDDGSAIVHFEAAVARAPDYADAHRALAQATLRQGIPEDDAALDEIERRLLAAFAHAPDLVEERFFLAALFDRRGKVEPAIAQLRAALAANSSSADAREAALRLARILAREKCPGEVIDLFRDQPPDQASLEAIRLLAGAYLANGDSNESERQFEFLTRRDPNDGAAWMGLAIVAKTRGDHDRAEACLVRALAGNLDAERAADARASLETVRAARADLQAQERELSAQIANSPSPHDPLVKLGWVRLAQNRADEALDLARRAAAILPSSPSARILAAEAYNRNGEPDKALDELKGAAQAAPLDAGIQLLLARELLTRDLARAAIDHLRDAVRNSPNDPQTLNLLAWLLATHPQDELRSGEQALALAERLCRLTERPVPAHLDTLAAAYAELGRFPEAIRAATEAANLALAAKRVAEANTYDQRRALYDKSLPFRDQRAQSRSGSAAP